MITEKSNYRGGSTVEVTVQKDNAGFLYSVIEVVSDTTGATLREGYADEALTATDAWQIATTLGSGRPTTGVVWTDHEAVAA